MQFTSRKSNDALSLSFPAYKIPVAIGFCATTIVLYTLYLQWGNALADSIDMGLVLAISGWILIMPSEAVTKNIPAEFRPADTGEQDSSAAIIETTAAEIKQGISQRDSQLFQHWHEDEAEIYHLRTFFEKHPRLTWRDCKPMSESTFLGILRGNPHAGTNQKREDLISALDHLRYQCVKKKIKSNMRHRGLMKLIIAWRVNRSPSHVRDVLKRSAAKRDNARTEIGDQNQI